MTNKIWKQYRPIFILILFLTCVGVTVFAGNNNDSQESRATRKFFLKSEPLEVNDIYKPIEPMKPHKQVCREIVRKLDQHYREVDLNDAFSSKLLDRYIKELDPTRSYFYGEDIREFEKYRTLLDDIYKTGELEGAFAIYNRYQMRAIERLVVMIKNIEQGLNGMSFTSQEAIDLERENAPWIESKAEMESLWQKRLKNSVLSLKLANKPMKDIPELLSKRFRSQLNRMSQTNSEDVFRVFINVLAQAYDPHTMYFSPSISEDFDIQMSLSLEGIGAVLQSKNEYTMVSRLVPAGPADKSKQIKPGDLIVGVGQGAEGEVVDVVGWRLDEVVQLIRGPKETVVRLEIIPENAKDEHQTRRVHITRNTVKLEEQAAQKEVVQKEMNGRSYRLAVLNIPTFYIDFKGAQSGDPEYKSTTRDVGRLLNELSRENIDGLIVDLRGNGGGALKEASELTGLFITKGPTVQIRYENGQVHEYMDDDPQILYSGPLVVLVDRMSASASEIFAGAIQDYNRGIVVGSQTFGKGTVQELKPLMHGQLKITRAKFYRISGNSTQHKGVLPDISYPSIYDMKKIGESAYPDALTWDRIPPLPYLPYQDNGAIILSIQQQHNERIKKDPDFQYLVESVAHLENEEQDKLISLNEKKRRQEIEKEKRFGLEVENKRRAAKGLESLKELETEDEMTEEAVPDKKKEKDPSKEPDPILNETECVLVDYAVALKQQGLGRETALVR